MSRKIVQIVIRMQEKGVPLREYENSHPKRKLQSRSDEIRDLCVRDERERYRGISDKYKEKREISDKEKECYIVKRSAGEEDENDTKLRSHSYTDPLVPKHLLMSTSNLSLTKDVQPLTFYKNVVLEKNICCKLYDF